MESEIRNAAAESPFTPDHAPDLSPEGIQHFSIINGKHSKKIVLLTLALAASLSICSIAWIVERRSAPKKTAVAIAPKKELVLTKQEEPVQLPEVTEDKTKPIRKDWSKYIFADNSSYAYGVLGGVSNLSIVFTNRTNYVLDEVIAQVTYIKSNGKPWKSKMVSVYVMAPHSERKQSLSKVNRGKSVEVKIVKIVSKQMHFDYAPGKGSKNSDDPYFMK